MSSFKYLGIVNTIKRNIGCTKYINNNSSSSNSKFRHILRSSSSSNSIVCCISSSNNNKRYFCTNQINVNTSSSSSTLNNENDKKEKTTTTTQTTSTSTTTTTSEEKPKSQCWCLINCKLESKRIHVSKVKPIPYIIIDNLIILLTIIVNDNDITIYNLDENDKGYVLGEYNINYESPLCESRKQVLDVLVREKDQSIQEQLLESQQQKNDEEKEKEEEKKQTKSLFKTEEEKEEDDRVYPVLNDTTTSIGPCHILYKNEWIVTVVERTETDNKDNEPYFVLKLKTPIRLTNDLSFNIESLSYFSSIEKLLSFTKSVDCSDKEFEKLFLTKSDSKWTKQETKWLVEKRPFLREALMSLKLHLLPSVGFNNCGINLELKKEDRVKCKQDSSLEFPDGVYQLCLEIDSTESIWKKNPETIEKILYLYTVMFDSLASINYIDDAPIDQVYL
ncbi:hypothetical protein PPL_00023 [Heterostelium album PN500]|uniref:Uncharacterized protein n=1 Tax=Heterostelium pallidum (strain ATCC 26659 / Pp 5 / PN500) TaxID=670386 RepID=D3BVM2_HETP5|nr:hypothetical protein PPL_00023 [Heterostelium album PN500]EFA74525.1 hypothetical protein PPL_00023 [Heterostelium album PN500]|eukprot:XP_020426659.1 hypothetical protein PPL_00023 [Heterostelium album PN500]